jgi:uncharacterized protein (AIM24 family)
MTRAVNLASAGSIVSESVGDAPGYMARAWVNFNGTGTVAIRASGNVSSITDNGTGTYTVNFTTAMADANYAAHLEQGSTSDSAANRGYRCVMQTTTSAVKVQVRSETNEADAPLVCVSVFR